jgi:DNA topoisomerase-1
MIVLRQGEHPNFTYIETSGKAVKKKAILDYISSLVIPPKYTDVRIHISMKGGTPCEPSKTTYTGVDDKGRTQYGYSKAWKARTKKSKYKELAIFGRVLPRIRATVIKLLKDKDASKAPTLDANIAMIISIVMSCHFRLGNLKYKDMYKSYGITNIEVRHLKIKAADSAKISFTGKKGVKNDCVIQDAQIIAHLKNMIAGKDKKDPIFTYDNGGNDCAEPVKANDVNEWMKSFDSNVTSKMFRTYATNVMLIELLKEMDEPEGLSMSARKCQLNSVLDDVSSLIHNTRAVCKKEYVHPDLIDMYLNHPRRFKNKFMGAIDPEPAFLSYLRS